MADETTNTEQQGGAVDQEIPLGRTATSLSTAAQSAKAAMAAPPAKRDVVKEFNDQKAAEKTAAEQPRLAALPPLERRRQEISRDPKFLAGDPALVAEMKRVLQGLETPEEREAIETAPLSAHREFFDIVPPDLPPSVLQNYAENFEGHEQDFLLAARREGLPSDVTRGLRDAGIELAMKVDGRPLPDEELDRTLARFGNKLTATQRASLKKFWRQIEGGAA